MCGVAAGIPRRTDGRLMTRRKVMEPGCAITRYGRQYGFSCWKRDSELRFPINHCPQSRSVPRMRQVYYRTWFQTDSLSRTTHFGTMNFRVFPWWWRSCQQYLVFSYLMIKTLDVRWKRVRNTLNSILNGDFTIVSRESSMLDVSEIFYTQPNELKHVINVRRKKHFSDQAYTTHRSWSVAD